MRRRRREEREPPQLEPSSPQLEPSPWLKHAPWIAALLALLVYLPSLGGGFLYDDIHVVVQNRRIQDLRAFGTILRYEPARPVLNLTWALSYAAAGTRALPYHLVNVLLHAANAALVAHLFRWMAERAGFERPRRTALLGACLFAATPMAAETVAYVSSRSTALATFFGLASLRVALTLLDGGPAGARGPVGASAPRLAASLAFLLLALATKEEAASVPLFLLLLDYFFVAGRHGREVAGRWRLHLPLLLLPALGLLGRRIATAAWLPPPALDRSLYLLTQLAAYPLYLLRHLVPLDPAFYRHHPPATWPPAPSTVVWSFATAAVAASALLLARRRPLWSFAVAWLAVGLLPSSSFVPLSEMVVDHRAYLGGAGVAFLLATFLSRPERAPFAIGWLVLLVVVAVHYEWVLADPVRAWEDAVRRAPASPDAQRALGEAYAARSDPRAEAALRRAVSLNPADPRSWTNLGTFYAEHGRLAEAAGAMQTAARAAPRDARVRDNLGLILGALGRGDEAVLELEAAVAADPRLAQPRIDLAEALIRRGDHARARALLEEAAGLEIDPQDAQAIEGLRRRLP